MSIIEHVDIGAGDEVIWLAGKYQAFDVIFIGGANNILQLLNKLARKVFIFSPGTSIVTMPTRSSFNSKLNTDSVVIMRFNTKAAPKPPAAHAVRANTAATVKLMNTLCNQTSVAAKVAICY